MVVGAQLVPRSVCVVGWVWFFYGRGFFVVFLRLLTGWKQRGLGVGFTLVLRKLRGGQTPRGSFSRF